MFGSSTPTLQRLATRLVSQCVSSSGCERNWSTFAFIHTKIRNRLTFKKLHKLVYVNYNLRIQSKLDGGSRRDDDDDPFDRLMELTLCDENNPIKEWMEVGRSTQDPVLDEDNTESDCPLPSHIVTDTVSSLDLQRETGSQNLQQWARKTIGDTHIGKRKASTMRPPKRSKRTKGKGKSQTVVDSDASTEDDNASPIYQESDDSSSSSDSGHDNGGRGQEGNIGGGGDGGGSSMQPLSPFTADQREYATQDTDHGWPTSERVVTGPDAGVQHGYGSYLQSEDSSGSSTFSGAYDYTMPDTRTQQPMRWVHEWMDPEFYEQLHSQWATTAHWTGQTWMEYKATLLQTQGIMVVSTKDYYAMHNLHG